jgi:6,7-dimethyl-8-ribityllumazine synthase
MRLIPFLFFFRKIIVSNRSSGTPRLFFMLHGELLLVGVSGGKHSVEGICRWTSPTAGSPLYPISLTTNYSIPTTKMASSLKNLSTHSSKNLIDISRKRFAILVSEWNEEVTEALYHGALQTLLDHGAVEKHIISQTVPGSYELSLGAQWMAERTDIDAVICLGCVIQGETRHFDFICDAVAHGLTNVSLKYGKPVIFGVLTPNTQQQALARAGGKHGNKGDEAAITAIKMLGLQQNLK